MDNPSSRQFQLLSAFCGGDAIMYTRKSQSMNQNEELKLWKQEASNVPHTQVYCTWIGLHHSLQYPKCTSIRILFNATYPIWPSSITHALSPTTEQTGTITDIVQIRKSRHKVTRFPQRQLLSDGVETEKWTI